MEYHFSNKAFSFLFIFLLNMMSSVSLPVVSGIMSLSEVLLVYPTNKSEQSELIFHGLKFLFGSMTS